MSDVLRTIGVVPRGGNYDVAWARIRGWDIDADHLRRFGRQLWSYSDEEVRLAVANSLSLAGAQRWLGRKPGGGGYRFLRRRIAELRIDTSHLLGEGWRRGNPPAPVPALPISTYLVRGSRYQSHQLRRRLIEEGLMEARCESCSGVKWMDKPMPLELDHVNGDRWDNRLCNLRLLCPNCHAQTDTYRGRNIGNHDR